MDTYGWFCIICREKLAISVPEGCPHFHGGESSTSATSTAESTLLREETTIRYFAKVGERGQDLRARRQHHTYSHYILRKQKVVMGGGHNIYSPLRIPARPRLWMSQTDLGDVSFIIHSRRILAASARSQRMPGHLHWELVRAPDLSDEVLAYSADAKLKPLAYHEADGASSPTRSPGRQQGQSFGFCPNYMPGVPSRGRCVSSYVSWLKVDGITSAFRHRCYEKEPSSHLHLQCKPVGDHLLGSFQCSGKPI
ncbi:hypothetical protein BKA65DRAFT_518641 [Rhexocercosporidium sp. MPI-PUGE-AT-0058]|nr:hypothetical protein BKA65DRAFT_518641 [Rhexocercosporidium sp. MPI-PUGE-AT-0058]